MAIQTSQNQILIYKTSPPNDFNNLVIICLTGYKGQNCWKQDCDGSETKTEFKLNIDWDCSGSLATIVTATNKNGKEISYAKSALCHGSGCKMPECPAQDQTLCHGISKYS